MKVLSPNTTRFPVAAALILVVVSIGCGRDDPVVPLGQGSDDTEYFPVQGFAARNDSLLWGTVHLSWKKPIPNSRGAQVDWYLVVADTTGGTIDNGNWRQQVVLSEVDTTADSLYAISLQAHSIPVGRPQTFGVIPHYHVTDTYGAVASTGLTPTCPHYRSGFVYDETGTPIAGAVVSISSPVGIEDPRGFSGQSDSDANGAYGPLGPTNQNVAIVLVTTTADVDSAPGAGDSYFDYRTKPLEFGSGSTESDIYLMTRRPMPVGLEDARHTGFVAVLQGRTMADGTGSWEDNTTMRKWDPSQFPLPVHIVEQQNTEGDIDLDQAVRDGMAYYNTLMGTDVFVETPVEADAKVKVIWRYSSGTGGSAGMPGISGRDFPVGFLVRLGTSFTRQFYSQLEYTVRHELGHTLCYAKHNPNTYGLMGGGSSVVEDGEYEVISALIHLPAEFDLAGYEESVPNSPAYQMPVWARSSK